MSENTRMEIGKFYETSKNAKYTQSASQSQEIIFYHGSDLKGKAGREQDTETGVRFT